MAALTVNAISLTSSTETYHTAAEAGDTFVNNGKTIVRFVSASGSPITVTIDSPTECSQGHEHDVTVTVPAGSYETVGPFPASRFNNSAGAVSMTYSAHEDLTVAVLSIG